MPIPFLDLRAQYLPLKDEMEEAFRRTCDKCSFILGPDVEAFEKEFASYCGVSHCVGVNSGTSALALLMQASGIKPGDEIITVANTFFATAEAVSEIGATPTLVDCLESSALMDPTKIESVITPRTKAIIPVHLFGQVADMDAINAIAKKHGLLVFEDSCQAHGALYKSRRTGGLADGAAFSFYPGKNLGAYGDAGGVTTNDAAVAQKIRALRDHGSPKKYHHDCIGWNERMDGLQGAVLRIKLKHLDHWNERRHTNAATYRKLLGGNEATIAEENYGKPVYHLFVVRSKNRDALQKYLGEQGIQSGIHYPIPLHLQPAYQSLGYHEGDFPCAEKLSREILSLPMFAELTDEQIAEVCEKVQSFSA